MIRLGVLALAGCYPGGQGDSMGPAGPDTTGAAATGDDTEGPSVSTSTSTSSPTTSSTVTSTTTATSSTSSTSTGADTDTGDDGGTTDEPPDLPTPTHKIKDLTGLQTSSGQFSVGGTDLGIPVRQPDGKIAYIFGDTFATDGVGGPDWRSPVLLRSEPGNLDAGITFTGAAGGQHAKQILDYQHNQPDYTTWLPSDAITIGDRMYLHYMVNNGLGNVVWSQIAYSDDDGENWALGGASWEGWEDGNLRQLWTWERGDDGYVYVLSTSFKRTDPILLHRVPEDKLLDKAAYEPWGFKDDQWAWGNPATVVLTGQFGEMCLRRVEDKWVLSWFNAGDYDITIKVFDSPTSNLYDAATYKPIKGTAWGLEDDTHVAQLYGGYIHPDSTLHDLHLIVSQWNTDTNWPYRAMQFVTGVD